MSKVGDILFGGILLFAFAIGIYFGLFYPSLPRDWKQGDLMCFHNGLRFYHNEQAKVHFEPYGRIKIKLDSGVNLTLTDVSCLFASNEE